MRLVVSTVLTDDGVVSFRLKWDRVVPIRLALS